MLRLSGPTERGVRRLVTSEYVELDSITRRFGVLVQLWAQADARSFRLPYGLEVVDHGGELIYSCQFIVKDNGTITAGNGYMNPVAFDFEPPLKVILIASDGRSLAAALTMSDLERMTTVQ